MRGECDVDLEIKGAGDRRPTFVELRYMVFDLKPRIMGNEKSSSKTARAFGWIGKGINLLVPRNDAVDIEGLSAREAGKPAGKIQQAGAFPWTRATRGWLVKRRT